MDLRYSGQTPLHTAAALNFNVGAQLLLDYGANIEATDNDGMTPLLLALSYAGISLVRQLLSSGAQLYTAASDKPAVLSGLLNRHLQSGYTYDSLRIEDNDDEDSPDNVQNEEKNEKRHGLRRE